MAYREDGKVVVIGGGTGLSVLLRGLKRFTEDITAIVTVADDGGSSGMLRADLGMLPPGDIRACLLSLANTEPAMERLLSFRFMTGGLKGQSFGNLFIAAMNEIYGNFGMAVKETSNVLNITGKVLPVTLQQMDLVAELENGTLCRGESNIPLVTLREKTKIKRMKLERQNINALPECLQAIEDADLIVLGPGSLYTSIIPNLLVRGISDAIKRSKAKKLYICNIMTQAGETDSYSVIDHVDAIIEHSDAEILDFCIVNNQIIDEKSRINYIKEHSEQVLASKKDEQELKKRNIKLIEDNYLEIKNGYVRHNALHLSQKLLTIADYY
ncbi:MAG: YvcK family protein [Tissierellia bacterium]|nr:YvcK family protein [Tissierellia bacterium]